ncbi:HdaA/DnaA family protein [Magnetospirillum fulvum]|jgi:DnaA regulatory inactivator Hda|uniref:Chromosomal replication initiator n=1 Tax=Magnetospirillum fulvum MGU-K5 TaxID=1316936 RepID=S9S3R7_MAGFU|nr:chromosomal replication initiator [Magnetospirillum fulvum]EPY00562.1 chromosomal replication initiator [Magnetospirillum fulvum MGU-K5]
MSEAQLPLDLGHRPALSAGDFLVAPCNADAHAWVGRWQAWPGAALVLTGPPGSGKTHLVHLFSAASGAVAIAAADLTVEDPPHLLATAGAVAVEDCDQAAAAGQLDEAALFHLINLVRETRGRLLLTGREVAARWPLRLADLTSRLRAMPAVAIGAPDDALLASVLVKLFADRQIKVGEEVVSYLLGRMERSFAAAAGLVDSLDRAALAGQRAVTVPLARAVLDGVTPPTDEADSV